MTAKPTTRKINSKKARRKRAQPPPPPPPPPPAPTVPDAAVATNKRARRKLHERRADMRDELWPGSADEVWWRKTNDGFTTIPRILPLMTVLLRHLTKNERGDSTSVYMELWARAYDEGYLQINNQLDDVYASGYTGSRALRTWQERMRLLEDHGFIKIKPNGAQEFGHVLLINPLLVAARVKNDGRTPDEWWAAFRSRVDEIGAEIPVLSE